MSASIAFFSLFFSVSDEDGHGKHFSKALAALFIYNNIYFLKSSQYRSR
jgi:hypothetical protein